MAKVPRPKAAPAATAPAATAPAVEAATTTSAVAPIKSKLPAVINDAELEAMSGAGIEEARPEDFGVPFLILLQKNSPEVDEIDDAEAGDLLAKDTKELWAGEEGVEVVPCHYRRRWIEYRPRTGGKGGGFVKAHPFDSPIASQLVRREINGKNIDLLANGNEVVDTAEFFVIAKTSQGWRPYLLPMKSTGMTTAREWLSKMAAQTAQGAKGLFTLPSFRFSYRLSSATTSNEKGTFSVFKIGNPTRLADVDVFEMAKRFWASSKAGRTKSTEERPVGAETAPVAPPQLPPTASPAASAAQEELPF